MALKKLVDRRQDLHFIVGKDKKIRYVAGENGMVLLIGTPGCGKSFFTIAPNIINNSGESMIIDDKKGMLFDLTHEELENQGYEIKILNLKDYTGNFELNIFEGLNSKKEIRQIVHYLIPDTKLSIKDPFWIDSARMLLTSIIGIGLHEEKTLTLGRVFELLSMVDCMNDPRTGRRVACEMDKYISEQIEKGKMCKAFDEYKRVSHCAEDTFRSILVTCNASLDSINDEGLFRYTNKTTLKIEDIGEKKTALFIISSDTDSSLDPFIKLIYKEIIDKLMEYADKQENKMLNNHVRFILDDFASGSIMNDFEKVLANCRSRNVSFVLAIQSIAQLTSIYGEKAYGILDCMNYKLYYPSSNYQTQNYLAELLDVPVNEIQNLPANKLVMEQIYKEPEIVDRYEEVEFMINKKGNYKTAI